MIDLQHPLAVLGTRLPWAQIEAELAPIWQRQRREGVLQQSLMADLFDLTRGGEGAGGIIIGGGVSAAGRPRLKAISKNRIQANRTWSWMIVFESTALF